MTGPRLDKSITGVRKYAGVEQLHTDGVHHDHMMTF